MKPMLIVLLAFVLLLSGCGNERMIPDPTIPHRLSAPTKVLILVRRSDGKMVETEMEVPKGWWVASPQVVE